MKYEKISHVKNTKDGYQAVAIATQKSIMQPSKLRCLTKGRRRLAMVIGVKIGLFRLY